MTTTTTMEIEKAGDLSAGDVLKDEDGDRLKVLSTLEGEFIVKEQVEGDYEGAKYRLEPETVEEHFEAVHDE